MATLVLDEQFMGKRLILALRDRGLDVQTVGDFGAQGRADPDVVRRIGEGLKGDWVLITMDLTILEDFEGFEWSRYAIAWVVIDEHLQGSAVEQGKSNVVQRHAHTIGDQNRAITSRTRPDGTRSILLALPSCWVARGRAPAADQWGMWRSRAGLPANPVRIASAPPAAPPADPSR